jgi:iron complex outermembrane receptor protein
MSTNRCRLPTGLKLGSALAALAAAGPLQAQDELPPATDVTTEAEAAAANEASDDEVIFVTARRRAEALTDVPLSITAYSGEQLENQGAIDLTDIGDTTPNVTLEASRGTNSTLTAFIRGVGQQDPVAGFEAGVGIYLDDVFLNRPQGALLDIYNVERIEVLRGPQGTLYGRNTIGGAIKYVTRRLPEDPEVRIRATVGTDEHADLVVSASTPVSSDRIVRVGGSIARLSRDGFGENLTTGLDNYNRDIWAGRLSAEINNNDNVFVRLQGDLTQDNSNPRGGHRLIPGLVSGTPVLADEFDSRGGLLDPEQEVPPGASASMPRSSPASIGPCAASAPIAATAAARRSTSTRCRRSTSTFPRSIATASSARSCRSSTTMAASTACSALIISTPMR